MRLSLIAPEHSAKRGLHTIALSWTFWLSPTLPHHICITSTSVWYNCIPIVVRLKIESTTSIGDNVQDNQTCVHGNIPSDYHGQEAPITKKSFTIISQPYITALTCPWRSFHRCICTVSDIGYRVRIELHRSIWRWQRHVIPVLDFHKLQCAP